MIKKLLGCVAVATLITIGVGGMTAAGATTVPIPILGNVTLGSGGGLTVLDIPLAGVGDVVLLDETPGVFICAGVQLNSDPSGDLSACYINGQNVVGENVDELVIHIGQDSEPIAISLNPLAVCTTSGCTGLGSLRL